MSNVIELVLFKLKEGVSEEQFLKASDEVNTSFLSLQKGYINRKLAKNEDAWMDIVLWETMDDAMNAAKLVINFTDDNSTAKLFFESIEQSSCEIKHLNVVKSY